MCHQSFATLMLLTWRICQRPVSMGDMFCFRIQLLPNSERLHKVKANKGMLLLPAEYSAPGSLEECHRVIAMTTYCQLEGLVLDAGEVITPPALPGERMVDRT